MADTQVEDQRTSHDGSATVNRSSHPVKIDDFVDNESNTNRNEAEIVIPEYKDVTNIHVEDIDKNGALYMNIEDEARVKSFLEISLNMDGAFSGHSSDYNQSEYPKESNDSDDSESMSSSNEEDLQCEICQKMFLDQGELDHHISSRRMDDKRYCCCNCQKTFRDNTQLKVHARKHTGEKPFECTICAKKFTVNGNLNKHMRIHTGEKRFECSDCGKKFTQFAHLEDHLKTHSGDRPFICGYCQASFKTKARLRKHEKSHTNIGSTKRSVNCPKCNIVLKSNRQLASHLSTHVQDTDGPFICHLCGKAFSRYPNLQEHQRSHIENKTFFCEFCDKKFASGSHLRRHMNSHSGFRPYSCSICKRPFPSSQNLKRHMMTHTGERPYDCTDCRRKFLTLENLNRHKRTHTGEKPFACEICGRVFAHSTTAKEHYRAVHTGEKPFGCSLCQQSFAISKMLYKHIRMRHPEYFPQFKKEQNLTPNMRKAMDRFRKGIKCEDDNVKVEFDADEASEERVNGLIEEEILKTELKFKIKEEPIEVPETVDFKVDNLIIKKELPSSHAFNKLEENEGSGNCGESMGTKIKPEVVDGDSISQNALKNENIDIPFIKTEKIEMEDC